MHRHPTDPAAPFRAAPFLGRLIAMGLLDAPECLALLAPRPIGGTRARLAHAIADTAAHWTARRARARRAIAAALAPLLAARAQAAQLRAAAAAANRAHGNPLRAAEVDAIARALAARALRA